MSVIQPRTIRVRTQLAGFRTSSFLRFATCFFGLLVLAVGAQAASVTINLGQTAQNFTMAGTGPNGSGLGTYVVTMGACTASGGNTSCTLSGNFTGSTPGFTSGAYTLVSTYSGTGASPFLGVQMAAGSNYFNFSSIPQTATMTLTLISASGTFVAPLESGSQFAAGASFGFVYGGGATCTVVSTANCNVSQVGLTLGSSITGPVTGTATFNGLISYYFSDLAIAGNYQTTLTYVNYSTQAVTCTTNFYLDSGAPWSIPFSSGTVTTRTDVLPPGGSIHDQTVASLAPPYIQGWALGTCTGQVQASLLYRYYTAGVAVAEAGVNAETSPTTKFATFAQTITGVAYANPSSTQSATITMTAYDTSGNKLGSSLITLGPLGHGSANVGPLLGISSFTGFVELTSNIPIVSLSLNAEAFPVISSLPPGDLPSSTTLH